MCLLNSQRKSRREKKIVSTQRKLYFHNTYGLSNLCMPRMHTWNSTFSLRGLFWRSRLSDVNTPPPLYWLQPVELFCLWKEKMMGLFFVQEDVRVDDWLERLHCFDDNIKLLGSVSRKTSWTEASENKMLTQRRKTVELGEFLLCPVASMVPSGGSREVSLQFKVFERITCRSSSFFAKKLTHFCIFFCFPVLISAGMSLLLVITSGQCAMLSEDPQINTTPPVVNSTLNTHLDNSKSLTLDSFDLTFSR